MTLRSPFTKDILTFKDPESKAKDIAERIKKEVNITLRRKGGVVGISGGIDSSVTLALAAKALGSKNVLGLILPEQDSNPDSKRLAVDLAATFGVKTIEEDLTDALAAFGCYSRRDEAVKNVIPEFDPLKDKFKIEIKQKIKDMKLPPMFYITVFFSNGDSKSKLLPMHAYLQIVAASNFKQRSRMSMLYYHAESLHYAVIGTPNKHEVRQGFFVKYGDGGADIMPIGQLYKTQVYQLAKHLKIPAEIIKRTPTTDTYTAEQSQEDFFYQLPFETMDLLWYGWENNYSVEEVAPVLNYSEREVENIFASFERKVKTTEYLRMAPIQF